MVSESKTKHGRRAIGLPASVIGELRQHRKEQLEQRLRLGMGKMPDDALVLATWEGSRARRTAPPRSGPVPWLKLKLPKVSLHALRHTHASQLIASGMDVLTISRLLGHSSPTITLNVSGH